MCLMNRDHNKNVKLILLTIRYLKKKNLLNLKVARKWNTSLKEIW